MTLRTIRMAATAMLAAMLWVVPSVGTQGQGTIGDRFVHADKGIVQDNAQGRALLTRADHAIARAVAGL